MNTNGIQDLIRELTAEGFSVKQRKTDPNEHEVTKQGFMSFVLKEVCGVPCFFTLDGLLYYVYR